MQSKLHILVAEDSPLNQKLALRILERAGHCVTIAANGREAVDAVRSKRFDLVLMDVEMPELDGISATKVIRSMEPVGTHLPIVAVTSTGDRQRCLQAGMDDFLSKPLSIRQLDRTWERMRGQTAA